MKLINYHFVMDENGSVVCAMDVIGSNDVQYSELQDIWCMLAVLLQNVM